MEFAPIATGYYLEALCVGDGAISISDVARGGIRRLSADGQTDEWLAGKRWIGGILLNEDGCVLSSGPRGIAWLDPATGASGLLLDAIDGRPIGGGNGVGPRGAGGVCFGTVDIPAIERGDPPGPVGLYRLDTNGRVTCLCEGITFTNGLGISPDGRRLYHNESFVGTFACELMPDRGLGAPAKLLAKKDCDGLAVDREGNVWITGFRSSEILVVRPDGGIHRRVATPAEAVTNVRFGGADGRDIYITG